ncbi:MAG: RloB family protein [Syntrophomonadaceae bacterium]|nr:RloB family protein [Syntrophomonadaceae bacterium]MDD3271268.1 RloB family protein [Syntrophomonadaceae bacterium]MDD3897501.1 RloB family protein [Syntrophomonadaceae bacterium]MDD4561810.1 RloB family protein [Syntrophomonadaceae bacterium]
MIKLGSDDLFKKNKERRNLGDIRKRKSNVSRVEKPRILIVCEGKKTEPQYFEGFRPANIVVRGFGYNTVSLVEKAIEFRKNDLFPFDQTWCVFDRDEHDIGNFNNAFILADKNDIRIAYSNEAFELWYCLHFDYLNSAVSRKQYSKILTRYLKALYNCKYQKNLTGIYDWLLDKQGTAIKNAEKLFAQYPNPNPAKDNPSTSVHNLVIELNKWI